jgi:hypothetical protein
MILINNCKLYGFHITVNLNYHLLSRSRSNIVLNKYSIRRFCSNLVSPIPEIRNITNQRCTMQPKILRNGDKWLYLATQCKLRRLKRDDHPLELDPSISYNCSDMFY